MREFWDRRAREDAFYFVDDRLEYRRPDLEQFWAGGDRDLMTLLGALGVAVSQEQVVVEIGCGLGRLTRPLAAGAREVVALDVSGEMLERARQLNPQLENVQWLLGDGWSLAPIEAGSADVCISHVVFQHIPDPEVTFGYVREMGRVLRPGGWAAFQVSNDPSRHRGGLRRTARGFLAVIQRAPRGLNDPMWRGSPVDLGRLRTAAKAGGLEIVKVKGAGTAFCLVLGIRGPGKTVAPSRDRGPGAGRAGAPG